MKNLRRHGAKISAEIVIIKLCHSPFDGLKLVFVCEEFNLYLSLAICGIWSLFPSVLPFFFCEG